MGHNPYTLLGIDRSASDADIKNAYRKLAKKLHPDVNPGRKDVEQKFKDVTSAYELLSHKERRAQYDRGEIDETGAPRRTASWGGKEGFTHARHPYGSRRKTAYAQESSFDPEDILAEFFGKHKKGFESAHATLRGEDVSYTLSVPFVDACLGSKQRVTLLNGKTIDVTIPPGTASNDKLRLRGLGQPGRPAGDALVDIQVLSHPFFTREGNDIHLEAPISLEEAVFGGNIKVPTLFGPVVLKISKGGSLGTVLRLKGKGVPGTSGTGDMFVKLKIVLPDNDRSLDALAQALEKWTKKHSYDPRAKIGW